MPFDKIDIESITEERRKSVAKSIHTISGEELKKLGNEV
jgi:ribosome recycling factor